MNQNTINEGKTLAVISYLTIIGSIIAIVMNKEKQNAFTSIHARQGLGLCLLYMIVGYFISQMDSLAVSSGFWICFGILFMYGIIGALTGRQHIVPVLGPLFQKWFKAI